jgi:hypothetical protein
VKEIDDGSHACCPGKVAVPNHSAVDSLGARHAAIGDHFVELGRACANVARGFIARHAAGRVGDRIRLGSGHGIE